MRVAVVTSLFPSPGQVPYAGSFVVELLSGFKNSRDLTVFVPVAKNLKAFWKKNNDGMTIHGIQVEYVEYYSLLNSFLSMFNLGSIDSRKALVKKTIGKALARAVAKNNIKAPFSILHGIELYVGDEAVPIAKQLGIPSVVTVHSLFSFLKSLHGSQALSAVLRNLRSANAITTVSTIARNSYPSEIRDNMRVIPNGYSKKTIGPLPTNMASRLTGKNVILSAGFFIPSKKFDLTIAAFAALPKHIRDQYVLMLIGQGEEEQRLRQQARDLDVHDQVIFQAPVEPKDMPAFYDRAQFIVQPSINESFSMICLEGMAYGKPFICSSAAGISEYVTDGREGFVVEPGNQEALNTAVLELASNQELRARMGQAAEETAEKFRTDRIAEQYIELYTGLTKTS